MVKNRTVEKRGKTGMLIKYKKLHDNTIFDGYYIPNKIDLFNRMKGAS